MPSYSNRRETISSINYVANLYNLQNLINQLNGYHGKSVIAVSSPPTILSVICRPQRFSEFAWISSSVNVMGQQTSGLPASLPHCDRLKKSRRSVDIGVSVRRLNKGRHCCKLIQVPFQLFGVLHKFSTRSNFQSTKQKYSK